MAPAPRTPLPAFAGTPSIPTGAGVGFKTQHARDIREHPGGVRWFEVHAENYMVSGGPRLHELAQLRADFPLSLHGIGLSLGGGVQPDPTHLAALRELVDRFEPALVSEHVAWSTHAGAYLPDLLPVPLTDSALTSLVDAIDTTQNALGRTILIENPSSYFPLPANTMSESEFITTAARRSGCRLLVDVNNVFVSAHNLGFSAHHYLDALPADLIGEIHLAGHLREHTDEGDEILIDTHGAPVADPVWELYARLIARIGACPTLIERDNEIPPWAELAAEARRAEHITGEACRASLCVS